MLAADDVAAAGGGDEDVALRGGFLHRRDFEAFHRGLQGVDGIDFGDDHAGAVAPHAVGTALADVAIAGDDDDLAGDHHVGRPLDAVGQRLAAAVEVVELALGDRVVDVDRGHLERARFEPLSQAMDAGGRFLGQPADAGDQLRVLVEAPSRSGRRRRRESGSAADHRGSTASARCTNRTPRCHSFPGIDRNVLGGDRGGRFVLRAEDIARLQVTLAPSSMSVSMSTAVSTVMCRQPAMRAPFERLGLAVFAAEGHEAGHLVLGQHDFFAAQSASDRSRTLYGRRFSVAVDSGG